MSELVEVIAKSLVDNPEKVEVSQSRERQGIVVHLKVDSNDMGKVIGKHGRIAKALRTVVKAVATRNNVNVKVEIIQI